MAVNETESTLGGVSLTGGAVGNDLTLEVGNDLTPELGNHLALADSKLGNCTGPRQISVRYG